MIEINQLKQLIAFSEYGTLSKTADMLHVAQPNLSRTMQHLESEFQVRLFQRTKNRLTLNENGMLAVKYAKSIVALSDEMVTKVRILNQTSYSFVLGTCAPIPVGELAENGPGTLSIKMSVEMGTNTNLIQKLLAKQYQAIIINEEITHPDIYCEPYSSEQLCFLIPQSHPLSDQNGLYFHDLDGESILTLSNLGMWDAIMEEDMPNSHMIRQNDWYSLVQLGEKTDMPILLSDALLRLIPLTSDRITIPILDKAAHADYYIACQRSDRHWLRELIHHK